MKIYDMQVNHQENPLGIQYDPCIFTWKIDHEEYVDTTTFLRLYANNGMVYKTRVNGTYFKLEYPLLPRTTYAYDIVVQYDGKTYTSDKCIFETGKMHEGWIAKMLISPIDEHAHVFYDFDCTKAITKGRIYIHALGLYEAYINDMKVSDEYLMPGYHSYNLMKQVQTFDITSSLKEHNHIDILLGDGWYKGRFVFDGGEENIYGDKQGVILEIHIDYEDGSHEVIASNKEFKVKASKVQSSSIYEGEVYDDTFTSDIVKSMVEVEPSHLLVDRVNVPIIKKEEFKVKELIITPKNEYVLDFGQNMTGWVEFNNTLEYGKTIKLSYGEVLQDGCFYRDNLRTAKAEFVYTSDGINKVVRPHFTFYGFRYVKVEGMDSINIDDFTAYLIGSKMKQTGFVETSNPKINQLFSNAIYGQKDNFLDIPTDCPQRDERMGWTGDANIISRTAMQSFDSYAFFHHYLENMIREQSIRKGAIPNFIPTPPVKEPEKINPFLVRKDNGISIWGDAATFIPWNMYQHSGDKEFLHLHYPMMKAWVDYIIERETDDLWLKGDHLGDWLALDTDDDQNPFGATDLGYTASIFYYYSTYLVAQAQKVLDAPKGRYLPKAMKIKRKILQTYFDEEGKFTIQPTQTACVLALYFDVYNETNYDYLVNTLVDLIHQNNDHLNTGFAGTPFLLEVLSKHGHHDLAYTLLLNEDYPSWLFAVNMGATTIWERWNSLREDGKISGTGMNSLNHYAYGSVIDWMYRYMLGIQQLEPGYSKVMIDPYIDTRIKDVKGSIDTPCGKYEVEYHIEDDKVYYIVTIPYMGAADFRGNILYQGTYKFVQNL